MRKLSIKFRLCALIVGIFTEKQLGPFKRAYFRRQPTKRCSLLANAKCRAQAVGYLSADVKK